MVHRRFRVAAAALASGIAATSLAVAAPQAQGVYLPQSGLIVVPFESNEPVGAWDLSTSTPGYVGDGYFVWEGQNYFNTPGTGRFWVDFEVDQGGNWRLGIRNRHEDPDPTEENDVWVKVDNGPWIKTFSNGPQSVGSWTWETRFELGHGNYPNASYNLSPGVHRIEFSGRSHGFKMDRFHLYRSGAPGAQDPTRPESPRRFGDASCVATNNSTGSPSELVALGSPFAWNNDVILNATELPSNTFGYYIASRNPVFMPNAGGSSGNLCVGGAQGRFDNLVIGTGVAGVAPFRIDLTRIPKPDGTYATAVPGATWYFQFWHRDHDSSGPTSNFTPGLEITFE